ncbi:hypothetical protein G6F56_001047 [Rhizopus delemar]|nr:hypothetical protein G6F56_001047 [Rhizopus delemar]
MGKRLASPSSVPKLPVSQDHHYEIPEDGTLNIRNNQNLKIIDLQHKAVLLLAIFSIWLPSSDIGRLQHRDVTFNTEDGKITGASLLARLPKEAQQKSTTLGITQNSELCPVTTLFSFNQQTEQYRTNFPVDYTLFLAYINGQTTTTSVKPATVVKWIEKDMQDAGIDTKRYPPHSIRSAASMKAMQLSFDFKEVKDHATGVHRVIHLKSVIINRMIKTEPALR